MVLLAGFPVIVTPTEVADVFADSRRIAFRNLDGSQSLDWTGNEFLALWGAQGLEFLDRDIDEGTAPDIDGSFIDSVTIGSRKVVLPVFIGTKSGHSAHLAQRSYLRSFFNHRGVDLAVTDGTLDLVATSGIGTRTLRCIYQSGMAGDWVADSNGSWWQRMALQLLAVRAYWYGPRWATPTIRTPSGVRWFGAFPPGLSSSRAFGTGIPVKVEGDVESWIRVDATGPAIRSSSPVLDSTSRSPTGLGRMRRSASTPTRVRAGTGRRSCSTGCRTGPGSHRTTSGLRCSRGCS